MYLSWEKNPKQIPKRYFVVQHYNEIFLKLIIDVNFTIDFKLCSKRNCKDISDKFLLTVGIHTHLFWMKNRNYYIYYIYILLSFLSQISKNHKKQLQQNITSHFSWVKMKRRFSVLLSEWKSFYLLWKQKLDRTLPFIKEYQIKNSKNL